jgi:hypothetical protein
MAAQTGEEQELSDMADTEPQESAFWEGRRAAKDGIPAFDNPYRENALFDPLQLAEWWNQGHKARRDAKSRLRSKGRARRWNAA